MDENKPMHLYKYCPWNEYTKKILWNDELYLASADKFNDPFDSCIMINLEGSNEDWFKVTIDIYAEIQKRTLTKKEKNAWRKIICFSDTNEFKDDRKVFVENYVMERSKKQVGVCCLSGENDNILMWSHYAKDHTGICLEFDYSNTILLPARKVIYKNDYPKINILDIYDKKKITNLYFTKATDWKYENEYRISSVNIVNSTMQFEHSILTGVICGEDMNDGYIEELKEILSWRSKPLTLYKAKKKKYQFGLDIEELGRFNRI